MKIDDKFGLNKQS